MVGIRTIPQSTAKGRRHRCVGLLFYDGVAAGAVASFVVASLLWPLCLLLGGQHSRRVACPRVHLVWAPLLHLLGCYWVGLGVLPVSNPRVGIISLPEAKSWENSSFGSSSSSLSRRKYSQEVQGCRSYHGCLGSTPSIVPEPCHAPFDKLSLIGPHRVRH